MSWEIRAAWRGNLPAYIKGMAEAVPRARTMVVRRRTAFLKKAIRRDIVAAGLGERLSRAVRGTVQPWRGFSADPGGQVASKALTKRPGGLVDILQVFEHGAVIHGQHGSLLAIPTKAAGRTGRRAALPGDFGRGDLYFAPSHTNRSVGFLFRSSDHELMFVLVRQVRITPRLRIAQRYAEAVNPISQMIELEIEKQAARVAAKTAA